MRVILYQRIQTLIIKHVILFNYPRGLLMSLIIEGSSRFNQTEFYVNNLTFLLAEEALPSQQISLPLVPSSFSQ